VDQMTDQPSNDSEHTPSPGPHREDGDTPARTRTENARDPSNPVAPVRVFVVVANRLPVDLERLPDGTSRWKRSPGGLVTALEPVLRSNKGAWSAGRAYPMWISIRSSRTGWSLHPVR